MKNTEQVLPKQKIVVERFALSFRQGSVLNISSSDDSGGNDAVDSDSRSESTQNIYVNPLIANGCTQPKKDDKSLLGSNLQDGL